MTDLTRCDMQPCGEPIQYGVTFLGAHHRASCAGHLTEVMTAMRLELGRPSEALFSVTDLRPREVILPKPAWMERKAQVTTHSQTWVTC